MVARRYDGDLVFTPLVLLWSVASRRRWNKKEAVEVGILLLLFVLLSAVVFGGWLEISAKNYPITFICGPVVIWMAFRFTQRETATGIFILSVMRCGEHCRFRSILERNGKSVAPGSAIVDRRMTTTAMALSAGMAERRHIEEDFSSRSRLSKLPIEPKTIFWQCFPTNCARHLLR